MKAWLVTWLLAAALAAGSGWRFDGSGRWPGSSPPLTWSVTSHVKWATKLPSWSNASPIVVGDRVCAATEPTTLFCADAATGRVAWQASHAIVDAVGPEKRAEVAAAAARRSALEQELAATRTSYASGLRALRASGAKDDGTLAALQKKADGLKAELDALPVYDTPPDQGMIGWSSPTPTSDGAGVYALFANGVVAAHELDGRLRWSRWLGRHPEPMLGWDDGHSASPVLAGDVLVVPFGQLTGLDRRTGAVLWQQGPWPHFGAPAVANVSGTWVVFTPDGRAVRARDGKVLAKGLGDVWYLSPVVDGDRVVFVEARSDLVLQQQGGMSVRAVRLLGVEGDVLRTAPAWSTRLPVREAPYASPLVLDGRVVIVTHGASVITLDGASGSALSTVQLALSRPPVVYASPTAAAGRVYVTDENGVTAVLSAGPTPRVLATNTLWPMRSSPAFVGARMYLRTREHLVAIEE